MSRSPLCLRALLQVSDEIRVDIVVDNAKTHDKPKFPQPLSTNHIDPLNMRRQGRFPTDRWKNETQIDYSFDPDHNLRTSINTAPHQRSVSRWQSDNISVSDDGQALKLDVAPVLLRRKLDPDDFLASEKKDVNSDTPQEAAHVSYKKSDDSLLTSTKE